jgi:hypothetical protein
MVNQYGSRVVSIKRKEKAKRDGQIPLLAPMPHQVTLRQVATSALQYNIPSHPTPYDFSARRLTKFSFPFTEYEREITVAPLPAHDEDITARE